jgi:hypothetical protein
MRSDFYFIDWRIPTRYMIELYVHELILDDLTAAGSLEDSFGIGSCWLIGRYQ